MLLTLLSLPAFAAPHVEPVSYQSEGVEFSGYLVWDDASEAPRPGLLMVPNWYGATPTAVEKAKAIAGTQYVVLVADIYGNTLRPADDAQAQAAVGPLYGNRPLLARRAAAAQAALLASAGKTPLDVHHIAAIGFCFGGTTVLEFARSGADLDAVVSLHGGLATPTAASKGAIHAPILAINGAADGYISRDDIAAFQKEMTIAASDWQFVQMGGAVHCFTEVGAASDGCRYDARAANRAMAMMADFLTETFRN